MFIGLGMPIPDLANKPGPGRPGFPVPGGGVDPRSFSFRVAGSDEVVIKANPQNAGGTFSKNGQMILLYNTQVINLI